MIIPRMLIWMIWFRKFFFNWDLQLLRYNFKNFAGDIKKAVTPLLLQSESGIQLITFRVPIPVHVKFVFSMWVQLKIVNIFAFYCLFQSTKFSNMYAAAILATSMIHKLVVAWIHLWWTIKMYNASSVTMRISVIMP